jgi:hypothetical protein
MPPIAVRRTDVIDKKLSPQRSGIVPPILDPTNITIQISDFDSIKQIVAYLFY